MKACLLAAGLGSLLSSGCRSELSKPASPDTTQLRAEFREPTGDFRRIRLEGASGVMLEALRKVEQVCGFDPFAAMSCPEGASCPKCHFEAHIAEVLAEISAALDQGKGDGHGPSVGGTDGYLTVDTTNAPGQWSWFTAYALANCVPQELSDADTLLDRGTKQLAASLCDGLGLSSGVGVEKGSLSAPCGD